MDNYIVIKPFKVILLQIGFVKTENQIFRTIETYLPILCQAFYQI